MASSFNSSPCQLKYSLFPPRQLNCFLPPSHRQLKYSSSSARQLKYSLSPCQLKDFSSSSRQLKYFLSPSCQLKDSSSSFRPSSRQLKYQVFLSFRIETRRNFSSELLQALKATGMNVFFDEEKLEKGGQFLGQLTHAIKDSNLSIIILSADYASSVVCLRELSCIMALKRNQGHIVFPVFFQVDPSDVQNLRGSFKTSFDKHQSNEQLDQVKVKQWKADLAQVGTLKGIPIKGDRSEAEGVNHIAEYAIQKLKKHKVFLSFAEDTRLNFTSHLLERLEDTGINVSDKAIEASDLSIVVLSKDYASSETCLAQLSGVMERKRTQKHIVIPIFYHVKPSDVQKNLGGSFKGQPQVQQWKDLAEVCGLQGWTIEGGYFDRPDTEYIKDVLQDVIKMLNPKSTTVSDGLIEIDDQKETILRLIDRKTSLDFGKLVV